MNTDYALEVKCGVETLRIFGHSLNSADKDELLPFFKIPFNKLVIYYKSDSTKKDQILVRTQLIKKLTDIIGDEKYSSIENKIKLEPGNHFLNCSYFQKM